MPLTRMSALPPAANMGPQNFDFFFIAMGTDYSFYVKSIATYAPTFFRYNNSVLAIVSNLALKKY